MRKVKTDEGVDSNFGGDRANTRLLYPRNRRLAEVNLGSAWQLRSSNGDRALILHVSSRMLSRLADAAGLQATIGAFDRLPGAAA